MATKTSQNATIALSDPKERAKIEAQRGIKRNDNGEIVLSDSQRKARVALLDEKISTFRKRIKNAEAEKKAHLAALK